MDTRLRRWIADATPIRADSDAATVHLPDTATALVYRRTAATPGDLQVVGPRGRAGYLRPGKDLRLCLRVRLRPGAARAAFGVPVSDLRDRVVPLAELWGDRAAGLESRLTELTAPESVLAVVGEALLDGLRDTADRYEPLLRTAAEALAAGERVGTLARRLAVSERRLRDLFTDRIGLSPKHFTRVERVRAVLRRAGSAGWAGVAADTGFYDQSHLTADFRALMGVSPAAFRAGRLPAGTPCAG